MRPFKPPIVAAERVAAAAARGIELGPVETLAGTVRTTWIADPDGNRVQIGQPG
jgi:hypothetical protein